MPRPMWRLLPIVRRERNTTIGRARVPEPMVMDRPDSVSMQRPCQQLRKFLAFYCAYLLQQL